MKNKAEIVSQVSQHIINTWLKSNLQLESWQKVCLASDCEDENVLFLELPSQRRCQVLLP